jgi:CheY-like chemotaxis protein
LFDGVGPPIPTVLITNDPDEAAHAYTLNAGVRCYLAKPLKLDELLATFVQPSAMGTGVSNDHDPRLGP